MPARCGWRWPWLLLLLLAWPGAVHARSGVQVAGLPGLGVLVAVAADPGLALGWKDPPRAGRFEPWLQDGRGPVQSDSLWLRIDLAVPEALRGQTAWLQLVPATAWRVRLHLPDGRLQEAGMGLPVAQHSHPSILPRFQLTLDQPQIRLYLEVVNTLAPLNHLSFLSDEALRQALQASAQHQALFIGAASLMLVLALMNWAASHEAVHRAFAAYIGSALLLVLCTNGYVVAYLVTDAPTWVARGNLLAGGLAVGSTMWFSSEVLQLPVRLPRLAAALRWAMAGALLVGLLGSGVDVIASAGRLLWVSHLVIGLLLLAVSAWLAWCQRDAPTGMVFVGYLLFNLFEKVPLVTMVGLLPVQHWSGDVAKLGLVFQMLLVHVHLAQRMRVQRGAEQRALAAGLEAQAERMQRADLSKFLGMFGHEVRTPLAIIDAATQSLELLPGGDDPLHGQRHQRIRAAVQRLDRLAREALSRERMAAGTWQLRPRSVALSALIDDTLMLQGLLLPGDSLGPGLCLDMDIGGQPGGRLLLELPPGWSDLLEVPDLIADPDLLQVALGNLLDNARKYADPGSQVQLTVALHDARGQRWAAPATGALEPARLHLSVVSQGGVLTREEREQVFQKYWRRDEHGSVGGAGLGLYLVRSIAQLHGGTAWADRLPDRRTAFNMALPLWAVDPPASGLA